MKKIIPLLILFMALPLYAYDYLPSETPDPFKPQKTIVPDPKPTVDEPDNFLSISMIDHISTHAQWTTKGESRFSLMSTLLGIEDTGNGTLGQFRAGFQGIANDNALHGANFVGDLYFNVAPLIRGRMTLDKEWRFLNAMEAGPAFGYDFREHHSVFGFSVGLAFTLHPKGVE